MAMAMASAVVAMSAVPTTPDPVLSVGTAEAAGTVTTAAGAVGAVVTHTMAAGLTDI